MHRERPGPFRDYLEHSFVLGPDRLWCWHLDRPLGLVEVDLPLLALCLVFYEVLHVQI